MLHNAIEWCQADRCDPRTCMNGADCPVLRMNKKIFSWTVVALLLVIALCGLFQHHLHSEEALHAVIPEHQNLYMGWYLSPNGALLYTSRENKTAQVSMAQPVEQLLALQGS